MKRVRPPAVAGMFYAAHPDALGKEIDEMLTNAAVKPSKGSAIALIVPHAGYIYSGFTAAHAYNLVKNKTYDTVVIISPSHRQHFRGISIYDGEAYLTPLGEIPVNRRLREMLVKGDRQITASDAGHHSEHAVEVQLPFLQKVLNNFQIIPIIMGEQRRELCEHLGSKLADTLGGEKILIVASSDLSHYHPAPEANKLDQIIIDDISNFDHDQLMKDIESERAEACGGGPVVSAMIAAKHLGANRMRILHHCNSGDVTGDRNAVVGYLSAAAIRAN